ncbi:hypothetical protein F5B17DRAFT_78405 [Nemania serpens]|nr:hypothetical protein F5B17DRAFT_78405 [Nemania serpens]
MCRYRQSIFTCNHTQPSPSRIITCSTQQAFESGRSSSPCGVAKTHACTTIRVPKLCEPCAAQKARLDSRFSDVRTRMAGLRRHLDEAYGECLRHVDGVGEEGVGKGKEKKNEKNESEIREAMKGCGKEGKEGDEVVVDEDPVEAFLKMKRNEKYSHLMMLGSYY